MKDEALAFDRLHMLTSRGYVAQFGSRMPSGGILLQHPKEGPDLLLLPSGTIESLEPLHAEAGTKLAIPGEDRTAFERFVDRLPAGKARRSFARKLFYLLLFAALWLFSLMMTMLLINS